MKYLKFPEKFLWGASSASHQVEGNMKNDWSEWEISEVRKQHLHKNGFIEKHGLENFVSGISSDHYNLFREDFAMAKELGHNATRISIEWSRIEPEESVFDQREIEHYKEVVKAIIEQGMEPFVTLWHWPIPLWLRDKGGWACKDVVFYFQRFTEKIVPELSGVTFWLTLNEIGIYSSLSYFYGIWPPQKKNPITYLKVLNNLILAHNSVYDSIKKINPKNQVSMAYNLISFEGVTFFDKILAKIYHWWINKRLLEKTKHKIDFIGLNYYFHNRIYFGRQKNIVNEKSDLDWHLHPDKISLVLNFLKQYNKPIYITENGLADSEDKYRKWFITESLKVIHESISEGVDVRGYLHWALTDNFEWAHGHWPKFGLVEINRENLERKIRPSARFYEKVCKNNMVELE